MGDVPYNSEFTDKRLNSIRRKHLGLIKRGCSLFESLNRAGLITNPALRDEVNLWLDEARAALAACEVPHA